MRSKLILTAQRVCGRLVSDIASAPLAASFFQRYQTFGKKYFEFNRVKNFSVESSGMTEPLGKSAIILDGKALAHETLQRLKERVDIVRNKRNVIPRMVIIKVGNNHESEIYVKVKSEAAQKANIKLDVLSLEGDIDEKDLKLRVQELNADVSVHGIIIQLPLPENLDEQVLIDVISPEKDIDGMTSYNVARLANQKLKPLFSPCTPNAVVRLLKSADIEISGKNVVVIGRSMVVGMPAFMLLTRENATVTLCHTKTENIEGIVNKADILIVAIGSPRYIQGLWIKPGAAVIDVGINEIKDSAKKRGRRLCGDVDFDSAKNVASHLTPVPGGVGPMTVAMLMENLVESAERLTGVSAVAA